MKFQTKNGVWHDQIEDSRLRLITKIAFAKCGARASSFDAKGIPTKIPQAEESPKTAKMCDACKKQK